MAVTGRVSRGARRGTARLGDSGGASALGALLALLSPLWLLALGPQAASLFAFATARKAGIGIVAHVTNAVDHQDEQFDKGTDEDTFSLLRAMLRAGHKYVTEAT